MGVQEQEQRKVATVVGGSVCGGPVRGAGRARGRMRAGGALGASATLQVLGRRYKEGGGGGMPHRGMLHRKASG